ncbi:MAG: hypothetical protein M0R77_02400 [Gammaproteobacteria bacterium]|nr:hypothetical protein [Gammaproteobacteria bacterium]
MEFLNSITEANILNKNIFGTSKYTARDFANIFFAYLCAIRILKSEFYGASAIADYLGGSRLQADGSLKGNDLDVLINLLFSDRAAEQVKFKDPEESKHFIQSLTFNMPTLRTFVNQAIKGQQNVEFDRRFLLYAENQLKVSDTTLKSIRRLCGEWEFESETDKVLVFTRLIQSFRSYVGKADILPILETVAKKAKLEDPDLDNNKDAYKTSRGPGRPKKNENK